VAAVLIVAPSDLASELGRTVLWRSGVERAFAGDPEAGFVAARALAPRLVVLDASTVEEAVSFVRRLREDPHTRPTAIAVLSHSHEDEERLREAGANVVLPGQVDPALWDNRLQELMSVPPRLQARIPVRLQAWFTGFVSGKEAIEGTTVNLSVRGALLETTDPLEVGSKLDMSFRLPGKGAEIKVVGQVAREAGSGQGRPQSAVKFLVLRDDARQRIQEFVDAGLASSGRPPATATVAAGDREQEQWERELRSSEARKTAILDHALDGIVTMSPEGRIAEFNRAAERMFGYERAQVAGKTIAETLVPPSLRERHRRGLARYLATGESTLIGKRLEIQGLRADGTEFPVELAIVATLVEGQRILTAYIRDISKRKRAEEEASRSEERFRALVENSTDVIALLGPDCRYLYVSPGQTRILGYAPDESVGRIAFDYVHPDDLEIAKERFAECAANPGLPVSVEVRMRHKDGSWRVVEAVGVNRFEDKSVRAVVANYRDITARKQAESLQAALYRVSEATSVARDMGELYAEIHAIVDKLMPAENFYIALYDDAAKVLTFPYFVDAVDPRPEPKKPGKGLTEYVLRTGEPLLATPERFAELQKTGKVKLIGGSSLDWLGVPLNADDRTIGVLVVQTYTRDVRYGEREKEVLAFVAQHIAGAIARKRAEQEIKRHVSLLQSTIESTADGLLVVDTQGNVVAFNQRFAQLWRIPPDLLATRDSKVLLSAVTDQLKAPDQFLEKVHELLSHPQAEAFDVLEFKDGRVFERYSVPQRQDGEPVGRVWSFRDVTERTQAEQALRQTEKLAAMGSLLAGVAHELNNPLSVILGQAELLRRTAGTGPLAQKADQIAQAAGRCASIVGNFLALARQRPPERRRVVLNEVIREALDIVSYPLRMDGVDVVLDLDPDLPVLFGDPHQLHQVVVNLVTNAQDAMRGTDGPRMMVVSSSFDKGTRRVRLEVSDTGPGIPEAVRSRLFEPFFTTKPQGQGTGLGLSLCQGIVENHGGTIEAESEEGKGALFRVALPLELRRDAEAEPAAGPDKRKGGKILVVDDETHVAGVLAEMLAVDGHRIDVAQNGALALDRLRQSTYDLVLSDIRMPELDGLGLYQEVRRLHPEMSRRFVFLTGDRLSTETGRFLAKAGAPSLAKPFHLDEVLSVVRRMLQAR
jgi:PAS domain S-box-containing protein